jgi:hypothetical protein
LTRSEAIPIAMHTDRRAIIKQAVFSCAVTDDTSRMYSRSSVPSFDSRSDLINSPCQIHIHMQRSLCRLTLLFVNCICVLWYSRLDHLERQKSHCVLLLPLWSLDGSWTFAFLWI